jgi:hypothetical protein
VTTPGAKFCEDERGRAIRDDAGRERFVKTSAAERFVTTPGANVL